MRIYQSSSFRKTQAFGEALAKKLLRQKNGVPRSGGAVVFALSGDLGSGKTTFAQGFFKGLGLKKYAQSPTFIIMRRHSVPRKRAAGRQAFKNIFHIDAYRLKDAEHLRTLGFEEILADPQNVILIEWPERIAKLLPKRTKRLTFQHGKKETARKISLK